MYSKLIIVGRAGRDAEQRFTPAGQAVASFSVATDRKYTRNDETVKETTWVKVSVWGKTAEVCGKYVKKGMLVLCEGRLAVDPETGGPRIWKDESGNTRTSFEMTADQVRFLSKIEQSRDGDAGDEYDSF